MTKADARLQGKTKHAGGRPKGFDKLRQHMRLCEMVAARQDSMTEAQISAAEGVKYLVARNKKGGKFTHLTAESAQAILSGQNTEDEIIEEWEKIPSTAAFTDLMNRVLGKPADTVSADVKGNIVISWMGEE